MAPGTLLQQMHLRSRMRTWPSEGKTFYEMGSGDGMLSELLLQAGFTGRGFDLNTLANESNTVLNAAAIAEGRYAVENGSFIDREGLPPVDIIASCMVIEHLEAPLVEAYFTKAKSLLKRGGRIVTFVPANMKAWGVEDEVAGHVKRYTRPCFRDLAQAHDMEIQNLVGLTWPLSNLLLPLSNYLVRRSESALIGKSMEERTVASGHRNVKFKTTFPWWVKLLINPITLAPWYGLQCLGHHSDSALVLYCEMTPARQIE